MVQMKAQSELYWELINLFFPAGALDPSWTIFHSCPHLFCLWETDYLAEDLSVWRSDFIPVVKAAENSYCKTDIKGCAKTDTEPLLIVLQLNVL